MQPSVSNDYTWFLALDNTTQLNALVTVALSTGTVHVLDNISAASPGAGGTTGSQIAVLLGNGTVGVLDLSTNELAWTTADGVSQTSFGPVLAITKTAVFLGGTTLFGTPTVYAYDIDSGSVSWSVSLAKANSAGTIYATPGAATIQVLSPSKSSMRQPCTLVD